MGPFTAAQAKSEGLVDELGYEDDVFAEIKRRTGLRDLNRLPLRTYFRAVPSRGDRIAMLVGEGEITTRRAGRRLQLAGFDLIRRFQQNCAAGPR